MKNTIERTESALRYIVDTKDKKERGRGYVRHTVMCDTVFGFGTADLSYVVS